MIFFLISVCAILFWIFVNPQKDMRLTLYLESLARGPCIKVLNVLKTEAWNNIPVRCSSVDTRCSIFTMQWLTESEFSWKSCSSRQYVFMMS